MALAAAFAIGISTQEVVLSVTVDGDPVHFPDVQPVLMNGRVLVPLRGVFEKMDVDVEWDKATRTVTASRPGADVEFGFDETTAIVNGKVVEMGQPAIILKGRAMVPLRFLSETVGAKVEWQRDTRTVVITSAES